MKILVDENIPYLAEVLNQCGVVSKFKGRELRNSDLIESECDALFVRSTTKVNEDLVKNSKVKFVGTATSGTDHIDIEYLKSKNIIFASAAGSNANSVAELVIYSILKWSIDKNISLINKTIGIIGFGNIGKIVADYANRLELKVLVNDPPLKIDNFTFPEFIEYSDLNELIKSADIITNHVPFIKSVEYPTLRLIDNNKINMIKSDSLFIHASRGYIVEEHSLIERLRKGEITAVIDVWENEPSINPDLAKHCIIAMPHVAGYSRDGKLKGTLMMIKAFEEYSSLKLDSSIIEDELNTNKSVKNLLNPLEFEQIYKILKTNRNFEYDHNKLLSSLSLSDKQRAIEFDNIRKQYPIRRESI